MRIRTGMARIVSVLIAILVARESSAEPVTVQFTGTVTVSRIDSNTSALYKAVQVGSPFMGRYTFDSAAADADPLPDRGRSFFSGEPYGIAVTIGPVTVLDSALVILSRHGPRDIYDVASVGQSIQAPPDMAVEYVSLRFIGDQGTLPQDGSAAQPPDLSKCRVKHFELLAHATDSPSTGFLIQGSVESLVRVTAGALWNPQTAVPAPGSHN